MALNSKLIHFDTADDGKFIVTRTELFVVGCLKDVNNLL